MSFNKILGITESNHSNISKKLKVMSLTNQSHRGVTSNGTSSMQLCDCRSVELVTSKSNYPVIEEDSRLIHPSKLKGSLESNSECNHLDSCYKCVEQGTKTTCSSGSNQQSTNCINEWQSFGDPISTLQGSPRGSPNMQLNKKNKFTMMKLGDHNGDQEYPHDLEISKFTQTFNLSQYSKHQMNLKELQSEDISDLSGSFYLAEASCTSRDILD